MPRGAETPLAPPPCLRSPALDQLVRVVLRRRRRRRLINGLGRLRRQRGLPVPGVVGLAFPQRPQREAGILGPAPRAVSHCLGGCDAARSRRQRRRARPTFSRSSMCSRYSTSRQSAIASQHASTGLMMASPFSSSASPLASRPLSSSCATSALRGDASLGGAPSQKSGGYRGGSARKGELETCFIRKTLWFGVSSSPS